jgi:CRP/FNR family transcriptional regulator, dissimilatory nitrate respiration regulator
MDRPSSQIRDCLHACRFFRGVQGSSLEALVSMGRVRAFSRGEIIFRQGDPAPGVFVVESGSVRVFKTAPSGKEHVLHFAESGSTFAEVAVLGGFSCPAYAEAVRDTTCVLLPAEAFRQALRENHDLCLQLLGSMALWVHNLVGLLENIVLRDAAGRLAQQILKVAPTAGETFTLPSLKKDIASHLNLTSETFSRTLGRLVKAGLVEQLSGGRLRILDHAGLLDIAEGNES